MSQDHSQKVKLNFEQKASEYESFMQKCVPDYSEMLEILIDAIPFKSDSELLICDLGSGTGYATEMLFSTYPKAKISCVDISPAMTDMAKAKLDTSAVTFEIADFYDYKFTQKYDIIVSNLALHHLVTDDDKKEFYKRVYDALKPGGVFYVADVVLGASDYMEEKYMELWKDWLRQYHSEEELMEQVIDRYYEEDRPASVTNHLNWLQEVGFSKVDVIWKKQKGAVFGGYR